LVVIKLQNTLIMKIVVYVVISDVNGIALVIVL